jgi:hypothetical protein
LSLPSAAETDRLVHVIDRSYLGQSGILLRYHPSLAGLLAERDVCEWQNSIDEKRWDLCRMSNDRAAKN